MGAEPFVDCENPFSFSVAADQHDRLQSQVFSVETGFKPVSTIRRAKPANQSRMLFVQTLFIT
jgi:hypothetical protein